MQHSEKIKFTQKKPQQQANEVEDRDRDRDNEMENGLCRAKSFTNMSINICLNAHLAALFAFIVFIQIK